MKLNNELGLSLRALAQVAEVNPSTVSRYITSRKIIPIEPQAKTHRYKIPDSRKVLYDLYSRKFKVSKKVQCFYNFKGGTGKTSLCFQTATHLALSGFKVLVVDADPQGHLSTLLGFNSMDSFLTLYDAIAKDIKISSIVKKVFEGLDCIPSNLSLTKIVLPLEQRPKREEIFVELFKDLEKEYDFIIYDTNPTISTLNRNIIVHSNKINIICETQPLSLNGMTILIDDLILFFNLMRMSLPELLILPNKYEEKSSSAMECMTALMHNYPQYLKTDLAIRKSEDINSAAKLGLPLVSFVRRNSIAFEDFLFFLRIFIKDSSENNCLKELPRG